ncbi:hypothetical protein [Flammeovirga aprica]|uniref:Thiamine pyrophosphokinase n=1 Tax=Flammeovirga aprica JL-4 TaxID=694437 RepID=A0A7X9RTM1_9BACT|nr:hypothetical protein [Flammeovirga aprica]NME67489.1 hypothetical protein [Flammeovirga aprica JL-4]
MSSHHIVRDDQEPAVLIDTLDDTQFPLLYSLLEWSPIVIASEQSYEKLLSLDIKIDVIFYKKNKDNISENMTRQNEFFKLVHYNDQLLETVLKWLSGQKHFALNFITDQLEAEHHKLLKGQNHINTLVIFVNSFKYILNTVSPYEKWIPKGVELIVDDTVEATENLVSKVNGKYSVEKDGVIKVFHQGKLIIGEKLNVVYDR